jgi:four helix bundle protein
MSPDKKYDLEQRTEIFSLAVRDFCRKLKLDVITRVYVSQVVRSAGSVASNYIEANDNLGKNDIKMKIRICKKESKETRLWLKHIETEKDSGLDATRIGLLKESEELMLIFAAILRKLEQ